MPRLPLKPRYSLYQPSHASLEPLVEIVAAKAGKTLLEWQRRDLAHISAIDSKGQFVHRRVCLSIPRQAGKTTIIEWYALVLAAFLGAKILWTVHSYQIIVKTLEDFRSILGTKVHDERRGIPYFNNRLFRTSSKTAQEGFWFRPFGKNKLEGCICFATRTKKASMGNTFDIVILDEAQEVTTEHLQSILPTTSSGAMHNPQFIYMGTPRRAGSTADRFEAMRSEALEAIEAGSSDKKFCYIEYGLDEIGDVGDEKRWFKANPSLVEGVANIEAIRELLPQLGRLAFAQDCLGVWLAPQDVLGGIGTPVIAQEEWLACKSSRTPKGKAGAYAIKFNVDGSMFAVCVALVDGDKTHVELVDNRASVGAKIALAEFVKARAQAVPVVVDGKSGSAAFIERVKADIPKRNISQPSTGDVIAANVCFLDAIQEKELEWYAPDGADEEDMLTTAAIQSYKRAIGKSGGWGFDGENAYIIEAAALAVWKAKQRSKRKSMEVFF